LAGAARCGECKWLLPFFSPSGKAAEKENEKEKDYFGIAG
jgi:hypothetical protein